MLFVKDFLSAMFFMTGVFQTLIGLGLAEKQYRVSNNTVGMFVFLGVSLLGILLIICSFVLHTKNINKECG